MESRQKSWPKQWLVTDERMGDRLWDTIDRLPSGEAGILVRHYTLEGRARRALAARIASICGDRVLALAVAGDAALAAELDADLVHNPRSATDLPFSRSVHSVEEARDARQSGASLVFVSPIYATRSHPGQKHLTRGEALAIACEAEVPAIALGGMDARKFRRRFEGHFYGWAGIDAWLL